MLTALVAILVVLWLLGFALNVAGAFIHILLVVAAAMLVFELLRGLGEPAET